MTREELAQERRERRDDFAQANATVADWCYYHHVSVHQYDDWKRPLAAAHPKPSAQPEFIPVDLGQKEPNPTTATAVTVRIALAQIERAPNFDPVTRRAVVTALAAIPC